MGSTPGIAIMSFDKILIYNHHPLRMCAKWVLGTKRNFWTDLNIKVGSPAKATSNIWVLEQWHHTCFCNELCGQFPALTKFISSTMEQTPPLLIVYLLSIRVGWYVEDIPNKEQDAFHEKGVVFTTTLPFLQKELKRQLRWMSGEKYWYQPV